ncbi:FACT complex subunit SSRP1-like [Mytilus edulis]|uniref:FACT complex subunit SSRP1-like n=1 Tax=Mytilus edulis TaxID=6550 RepID=UPI0039F02BA3
MSDFQEYGDVVQEIRGAVNPGRLKLQSNSVIFKNNKTGKVEQFTGMEVNTSEWLKRARGHCLKFRLNNGNVHRFDGFKDDDFEKLASFISKYYSVSLEKRDVSVKGWNWGLAKFEGNSLEFDIDNKLAFEIPLNNVSHSTTAKNEVTLEFHMNDDAAVSLTEIRFHIPNDPKDSEKDTVQEFYNQVVDKADIIQATGDAICNLSEVQCLTPRGRYDIKIYGTFLQLHGKTFDYKIPYTTVLRLFLLPHKDGRQVFFVVSLDPPIKQGQTRYHFLILLFNQEDEMTIDLSLTEEELETKFDGKLQKEMSGPEFELVSRIFKSVTTRKITVPGTFKSNSGAQAIGCSYKAATGFLYPLERGFIFVHKPPMHIRFDEIGNVNFARSAGNTRSFDFDVETKSGTTYNFVGIEKDEYGKLYDFVSQKKLSVKNIGGKSKQKYDEDILASDNEETNTDHYLERMKQEGKDRFSGDEDDDSDSSDESFNPGESGSEVAEEYDSNPPTTSDSETDYEYDSGGDNASEDGEQDEEAKEKRAEKKKQQKEKKEKEKKEKKSKTAKTVKEGSTRKKKKQKKDVDPNKPKRPMTSYMMWFSTNRNDIKEKNPDASITDISKKGGELWRAMDASERGEWEQKFLKAKEEYNVAMEEYLKNKPEAGSGEESGDGEDSRLSSSSKKKKSQKSSPKKAVDTKAGAGGNYKSKEYISSDSSSDSDAPLKKKIKKEKSKPKEGKKKGKEKGKKEQKKKESEDEKSSSVGELPSDEEILATPESSHKGSGSESGSD